MDSIQLTKIRGYGYCGVLPEEQVLGQWFEVDLVLWLDLSAAGQSDRLSDSIDYRTLIATVQQLLKTTRFALLERMAAAIAQAVLTPATPHAIPIHQVQVRLTKPAAPIPDFDGAVTIAITRTAS